MKRLLSSLYKKFVKVKFISVNLLTSFDDCSQRIRIKSGFFTLFCEIWIIFRLNKFVQSHLEIKLGTNTSAGEKELQILCLNLGKLQ